MTIKRLILIILTPVVAILLAGSLFRSLGEPQITNRLQLYQTDLLLYASEAQAGVDSSRDGQSANRAALQKALLGEAPLKSALTQYKTVRKTAGQDLQDLQSRLDKAAQAVAGDNPIPESSNNTSRLEKVMQQQQGLLHQLDLRIGVIQSQQGHTAEALTTWENLQRQPAVSPKDQSLLDTAIALSNLYSTPPKILPNAEPLIQEHLDGWFRFVGLSRLYELQQRTEQLAILKAEQQTTAQQTLFKVALVGTVPILGALSGSVLLLVLIGQRIVKGKQALLSITELPVKDVPWTWEDIGFVLVVGFFTVGQVLIPLLISLSGIKFAALGVRANALYALTYYLLLAGSGLLVLYLTLRPHKPLPEGWFRIKFLSNWPLWGIGSYLVALPLMLAVSLVNQRIWQGEGGSNPLLQIVLEENDPISLGIFFFTAAIAAPFFEETLFRGFLLPSLTRYFPTWGAIAVSSLIFATAHLSLSEVLPLAVLGSVLGFVYVKSGNLLASMLLHSLWNSITMIGLFILGSGIR
jgi:membrane protease YdiL (CAAX protease family)